MKHADIKAMMAEIAPVIREYTAFALAPIVDRLDDLDKKLAALPAPRDGKDADEDAIAARVIDKLAGELAEIRVAVSNTQELPDIATLVKEAVAAIPAPQDGKSVTLDDVRPLIEEGISAAVAALPAPKDGCGIKNLLIDRAGNLVATMDDGRIADLGPVVGKDADVTALEKLISDKIDALPKPKDGKDGFSLKDFDATLMEDGRTVLLSFEQGDQFYKVELGFPVMVYRGVFKDGQTYAKGDTVTWGGSLWHCDAEETTDKPDGVEKHWTLATKRGRDGKDATVKAAPEPKPLKVG